MSGGWFVTNASIPVMRPRLPFVEEVVGSLATMDQNRIYSNHGPLIQQFEEELAAHFGVESTQVVTCSSATMGIAGLAALSSATKFLAPGFSFPATFLAPLSVGKRLEILDVEHESGVPSLEKVRQSKDDIGYLHVAPFGDKVPDEVLEMGQQREVIVDAAASFASLENKLSYLPSSCSVVVSLHATKILGVGEGGVVVFGSKNKATLFRKWINFGFSTERSSSILGFNGKLSEVAAAYGLAALKRWPGDREDWQRIGHEVEHLASRNDIASFTSRVEFPTPYFVVRLNSAKERESLESYLASQNIESRRWWPKSANQIPALSMGTRSVEFPGSLAVSQMLADTLLGLPKFLDMKQAELSKIDQAIGNWRKGRRHDD